MAQDEPWNRREALGGLAGIVASLGMEARAAGGFPMVWVFESRSSELRLIKFEWSNLTGKVSLLGGHVMWLSSREPKEFPFASEELEGIPNGIPEWIDMGWRSPVDRVRDVLRKDAFRDDYTRASEYEQRVYPRAVVPPSVIAEVRHSEDKALKLQFVFDDSKAHFEYEVHKWR